ncbi:MAG: hypothetical protein ABJH07_00805 [Sedimentitalea sp.]|uniref:hypothetical protein n=1 Tax=Sedimentitalea sp. TaxID=2048915 RepID=UPI0032630BE5
METLIPGLVAALSAGAIAAGKDLGGTVVKDAYTALKTFISDRYKKAGAAVEALEEDPESDLEQQVLEKRLIKDNAAQDTDLADLTKTLLAALTDMKDDPQAQALFDFGKLEAAGSLELDNIETRGTVLKAESVTLAGDFKATNIRQKN